MALPRRLAVRADPPAIAAWTLAFAVVTYLALSNGGYDTIVRSQVGIAVWWIVLLGALAGILPGRIGRTGWVAIGLLAAFAVWTGLATGWSESAERSTIELGRVATYLGVLVLAIALQGRAAARHTINGLACAIGFVTLLAVLSRLHPQWFPADDHIEFLAGSERKLSYPLNYWNALAAFTAIGVPLLLGVALTARTLAGQALAAATLPLAALCIYLTISRGGVVALVVGIVVFLLFVPRRLDALGTLVVAGLGSAVLLSAASQRPDILNGGVPTATAIHQGSELIWLAVIVCGGVPLLQVAMSLAARHLERPALLAPGRRTTLLRGLALVAVTCVVGVGAGAPGWVGERWQEFKMPTGTVEVGNQADVFSRLQAAHGQGRYQFWQAARDAEATHPWRGVGPGTFEFWWARHATAPGFVRDAHSLYFETLAETGLIGFVLLIGLLLFLLGTAVARSLRAPPVVRISIASAVGGLAAFMTSAAVEWVWEMGAVACAVMVLAAVILVGRDEPAVVGKRAKPARPLLPRIAVVLLALAATGAVAVPMAAAIATRDSRDAAAAGRLSTALADTRTAERLQPYAATPHLQRALVLEQAGSLVSAVAAAKAATADEPTNWRTWFVLARIEARRGQATAAVAALREAKRLNPRSPLLGAQ
ncbi:MAG: hypothetical protein QOG15_716 [Solirubrobacteraceae bacterium]|nr:hypothetical protein [Solirubrobacteraceae bacterium]